MLIGRQSDLQKLDEIWADVGTRVVSLVGPPGVGKTALATAFAEAGGLEMVSLVSEAEMLSGVARALGLRLTRTAEKDEVASLGAQLAGRSVVLDNAEHLPDAGACVKAWHQAGARLLVTSRVPLRVPHEQVVPLDPLSPEAAAQLYEARSGESADGLVRQLLARVEHLPLAIELAAARSLLTHPGELLRELESTGDLPVDDGPGGSLRHSIVRSLERLSASDRLALARLALFRAPFTLEDARSVLDTEDAAASVSRLLRAGLLRREEQPDGYRFAPFVSVRDVARAELAEQDPARQRYIERVLGLGAEIAAGLHGPRAPENGTGLSRLYPELRTVILEAEPDEVASAARDLRFLGLESLSVGEWMRLSEVAWRRSEGARTELRLWAALARAQALSRVSGVLVETFVDSVLRLEQADPSATPVQLLIRNKAVALRRAGDLDGARRLLESLLARDDLEDLTRSLTHSSCAILARMRGDAQDARKHLDAGQRLAARAGMDIRASSLERELAMLAGATGRLADAHRHAERALALARAAPHRPGAVRGALWTLAVTRVYGGEPEVASRFCDELIVEKAWGVLQLGELRGLQARLTPLLQPPERAVEVIRATVSELSGRVSPRFVSELQSSLAASLFLAGQLDEARLAALDARTTAASVRFDIGIGLADAVLTLIELRAGTALERPLDQGPDTHGVLALVRAMRDGDRERIDAGLSAADETFAHIELRLVARMIRRGWARPTLRLGPHTRQIQLQGQQAVDLRRRHPARRVLEALVAHHPGREGVDQGSLIEAGWPGERLAGRSGRMRLHTTIRSLRKLGFEDVLQTTEEGYRLDPELVLVVDPDLAAPP